MDENPWGGAIISLVVVALVVVFVFAGAFIHEPIAVRALENQGFTSVHIIKKNWFLVGTRGCDGSDVAKFTARAVNPAQKEVELFVCVGWPFKGATVRSN